MTCERLDAKNPKPTTVAHLERGLFPAVDCYRLWLMMMMISMYSHFISLVHGDVAQGQHVLRPNHAQLEDHLVLGFVEAREHASRIVGPERGRH